MVALMSLSTKQFRFVDSDILFWYAETVCTVQINTTVKKKTMSIDTVSGGKVWSPEEPSDNSSRKDSLIRWSVSGVSLGSLLVVAYSIFVNATDKKEYLGGDMTPKLWRYATNDISYELIGIVLGSTLLGLMAFIAVGMMTLRFKLSIAISILAFVSIVWCSVSEYNTVLEWHADPKTNPAAVWMAETYNYGFIELVDNSSSTGGSTEKVLVKDLNTDEEKIVHYYENDDRVYLAVDDTDYVSQFKAHLESQLEAVAENE